MPPGRTAGTEYQYLTPEEQAYLNAAPPELPVEQAPPTNYVPGSTFSPQPIPAAPSPAQGTPGTGANLPPPGPSSMDVTMAEQAAYGMGAQPGWGNALPPASSPAPSPSPQLGTPGTGAGLPAPGPSPARVMQLEQPAYGIGAQPGWGGARSPNTPPAPIGPPLSGAYRQDGKVNTAGGSGLLAGYFNDAATHARAMKTPPPKPRKVTKADSVLNGDPALAGFPPQYSQIGKVNTGGGVPLAGTRPGTPGTGASLPDPGPSARRVTDLEQSAYGMGAQPGWGNAINLNAPYRQDAKVNTMGNALPRDPNSWGVGGWLTDRSDDIGNALAAKNAEMAYAMPESVGTRDVSPMLNAVKGAFSGISGSNQNAGLEDEREKLRQQLGISQAPGIGGLPRSAGPSTRPGTFGLRGEQPVRNLPPLGGDMWGESKPYVPTVEPPPLPGASEMSLPTPTPSSPAMDALVGQVNAALAGQGLVENGRWTAKGIAEGQTGDVGPILDAQGNWTQYAVDVGLIPQHAVGRNEPYWFGLGNAASQEAAPSTTPDAPITDPNAPLPVTPAEVAAVESGNAGGSSGGGGSRGGRQWIDYGSSGGGYGGGGGYSRGGRSRSSYDDDADSWEDFLRDFDDDGDIDEKDEKRAQMDFAKRKKTRRGKRGGKRTRGLPTMGTSPIRQDVLANLSGAFGRDVGGWPERGL